MNKKRNKICAELAYVQVSSDQWHLSACQVPSSKEIVDIVPPQPYFHMPKKKMDVYHL